jgi:hypothetical protein
MYSEGIYCTSLYAVRAATFIFRRSRFAVWVVAFLLVTVSWILAMVVAVSASSVLYYISLNVSGFL